MKILNVDKLHTEKNNKEGYYVGEMPSGLTTNFSLPNVYSICNILEKVVVNCGNK